MSPSTRHGMQLPASAPDLLGFNVDSLRNLTQFLNDFEYPDFRGVVVIKENQVVYEEYFHTYWGNTIHDIRSAGKSVTALLLGIAMKEGLVHSLDQDVYSFFSKAKYPSLHEGLKKVKLQHLLDMSSGLDADADDSATPGNASNWIEMDDWRDYLLGIPLVRDPGEKWVYADINPLLIAAVIEETSGMSLKDYANDRLFIPLGITQFYWYTNAANQTGAAGNLYLTTLDFAKIGLLVANQGKWQEEQLVRPEFIQGLSASNFRLPDEWTLADTYGMLWYKAKRTFGNHEIEYLFASGNGGNHLIVVPEKELVVALTSSAYRQWYSHRRSYAVFSKIVAALE